MNIYKNKKNGELYIIEYVSPPKILGSWYEATPLYSKKAKHYKKLDKDKINKLFEKVSHSNKVTRRPNPFNSTF